MKKMMKKWTLCLFHLWKSFFLRLKSELLKNKRQQRKWKKKWKNSKMKLHIVKDVGMRNEASPESVHPVIRPLSIRPVVHVDRHPGSSKVAGCTPSLCWVWHCSFLPTKNGKEINQEWNNNNLRWWCCCCCGNVASLPIAPGCFTHMLCPKFKLPYK